MKDLTKDSILGHLLMMIPPVALSVLVQVCYHLIILYFVASLGAAAVAGVNAAGNFIFIISALTQVLGVGTAALVAHAVGRKDREGANLLFNQSLLLSMLVGSATTALLYAVAHAYLRSIAADAATVDAGVTFLYWVLPGYAMMFPWIAISSGLRGTGILRAPIIIYMITLILNALLAPVFISGWGTGVALGVRGAGLATSSSIAIGLLLLVLYTHRRQHYLTMVTHSMRLATAQWRQIMKLGLPASSDSVLTFFSLAVVYYAIVDFGVSAQAGFSIGSRILQTVILPGMSIALAAVPIAGQNFGARSARRVRETFYTATLVSLLVVGAIATLVQWRPHTIVTLFSSDAASISTAAQFLQLTSWTLVAQVLTYMCSAMFQGLGNTVPSLIGSFVRFFIFAVPTIWCSRQAQFQLVHVWHLWNASIVVQMLISLWLLRVQFARRLEQIAQSPG